MKSNDEILNDTVIVNLHVPDLLLFGVFTRDVPIRFFCYESESFDFEFLPIASPDTSITHQTMKKSEETDPGRRLHFILFTLFYHLTLIIGIYDTSKQMGKNVCAQGTGWDIPGFHTSD